MAEDQINQTEGSDRDDGVVDPVAASGAGAETEVITDAEVVDAEVVDAEEANNGDVDASPDNGDEVDDQDRSTPEEEPVPETELELAVRERGEYLELAQRSRAELENFRKRAARDAAEAEKRGRGGLAKGLIPAIDNLERALLAAGVEPDGIPERSDNPPSEEVSAHRALAEGVALVYRDLRSCLERAGVQGYDPVGEPFDPAWHEAIAAIKPEVADGAEPVPSGTVLETLEKGYRLGDQSLRPARVVVSE